MRDGEIKKPKGKGGRDEEEGGEFSNSLYTESHRKDPLSCLRMDDFEIYLRCQTYDLKLNRAIEKFISRVKWLPISAGLDVFKESHLLLRRQREALFEESKRGEERVRQRFNQSMMKKTDDIITRV